MNETTEITITTITFKRRGPQLKKLQVPNSKREGERERALEREAGTHAYVFVIDLFSIQFIVVCCCCSFFFGRHLTEPFVVVVVFRIVN